MKYLLTVLGVLVAAFLIFFGAGRFLDVTGGKIHRLQPNGNLSLVTEPSDGIAPVLRMIENASTSVDLVMYELDDERVESVLVAAKDRGLAVRVLLSRGYDGQPSTMNESAYQYFQANGVSAKWTPAYFALTHEKALVVDGDAAMIMTLNLTPQYYATSRDFGIIDGDRDDVNAIEATFDADWQGNQVVVSNADDLVWSPGSEDATIALIDSAMGTLDVYNEEMADGSIVSALESAARRGVSVRVDMTYASEWKSAFQELAGAGVHVRTYAPKALRYIHAKVILVDNREAFVGSQNFSFMSENKNRELGIFVTDLNIIKSLSATFDGDWENAAPFPGV
jgi:phosphatidylserine/phosphatidylglycerophosphate/cardiolipin synthase-like enzyme